MSTHKEHDYPRAPLTVTLDGGRTIDFEDTASMATWRSLRRSTTAPVGGGPRTTEVSFYMDADDWRAVVAHIDADLNAR